MLCGGWLKTKRPFSEILRLKHLMKNYIHCGVSVNSFLMMASLRLLKYD